MRVNAHRGVHGLLIAAILAGSMFLITEAHANAIAGRKLRAEAGTVLSADLHLIAERESRRRGVSLPAVVAPGEAETSRSHELAMVQDGKVTIVVSSMKPSALVPELQARGMTGIFVHDDLNLLRGDIPIEKLFTLEDLAGRGVLNVHAEYMPRTSVGAVTSQADWLMEADRVRDSLGAYNGTGQRIGTLSDSYNRLGGAAAGIASGDLPPTVTMIQEGPSTGVIDEGRAMIELMYDLAPSATYAFATAFEGGQSGFASNITALAANTAQGRCTVIVDDVFYLAEPMFQDGQIAQAINNAVTNRNVTFFSATGNVGDQAWEGVSPGFVTAATAQANGANFGFFTAVTGVTPSDYTWLDFDPAAGITPFQTVTLPSSSTGTIVLQWDDPFYAPLSVNNDLDFFVVNASTGALVAGSLEVNRGSTEPAEIVQFGNSAQTTYRLYIGRYVAVGDPTASVGNPPSRVKWVNFGRAFSSTAFATNSPTINPHAAAVNAMAVGAVDYFAQQGSADFSAKGPTTIIFSPTGVRLASPVIRDKPDFAAIQGTNTTFFPPGGDVDGDGFPNFFGTSAAAPHAAAIAALVRQRYPAETPAQIYQRLRNSADQGTNPTNRVGAGLINAWKAVYGDPVPATPPYASGFESGFLDREWQTRRTGAHRTQVTSGFSPAAGSRHLALHSSLSGILGRSEATLNVDVTGYENVQLSFLHRRGTSEVSHPMPPSFTGSSNTDGVAYSVDGGTTWKRIVSLTGSNSTTTTQPFNFNLSTIAANNGDALDGIVLIRFQEYDSGVAPSRGHFHDEIVVTATEIGPAIPGDVNDDGIVNVADATLLRLYLEGKVGSVPSLDNADFNEDSVVNAQDFEDLVNFIVNQ